MTNQKTPVQGGATEEQIEAAARALFEHDNPERAFAEITWVEVRSEYRAAARAALSVSASADPADEPPHIPYPGERFDPTHEHDWADNACQEADCMARPNGETQPVTPPSALAHPADEHHDAEERQAKSPTPGKRLDPEFRATLVDFAAASIRDVWADVPAGVDAETLAHNVVSAQEFAWISRGYPVTQAESEDHAATVTGDREQLIGGDSSDAQS